MRYINVDAFINDKLSRICSKCDRRKSNDGKRFIYAVGEAPCRACELSDMMDEIDNFPIADVEKVRHGEWIDTGSGQKCSVCGEIQYGYDNYRYRCSYCGAKMDGGKE